VKESCRIPVEGSLDPAGHLLLRPSLRQIPPEDWKGVRIRTQRVSGGGKSRIKKTIVDSFPAKDWNASSLKGESFCLRII